MEYNFRWNEEKAAINQRKHGVDFDTALNVFFDPYSVTRQDRIEGGEYRWQTIGMVQGQLVLLVAHTVEDEDFAEGTVAEVRIISARKATKKERKDYERNRTQI